MASHSPLKFGFHGHCGSGDTTVLVYCMILQHNVNKGPDQFTGRSTSKKAIILQNVVPIDTVLVETLWF